MKSLHYENNDKCSHKVKFFAQMLTKEKKRTSFKCKSISVNRKTEAALCDMHAMGKKYLS